MLVPILFATFLLILTRHQQAAFSIVGVALALVAAIRMRSPRDSAPRVLAAMVAGSALLILACIAWSVAYAEYVRHTGSSTDIFRGVHASVRGPLYGRPRLAADLWTAAAVGVAAATLGLVAVGWKRDLARPRSLAALVTLHLAAVVTFAMTGGTERLVTPVLHQARFFENLSVFSSPAEIFGTYVDAMPTLHRLTRHYPPGHLLIAWVERAAGIHGLAKALAVAATVATPVVLASLMRELGEARAAPHALLLGATSAAPTIYATTDFGGIQMLLAASALWALARTIRTGGYLPAVALALVMVGFTLLSASAFVFGASLAIIFAAVVARRAIPVHRAAKVVAVSLAGYAVAFGALRAVYGFDVVACVVRARPLALELMGVSSGFDDPLRYLLRSSGNLLAFWVMAGLPLSALTLLWAGRTLHARRSHVADVAGLFAGGSLLGTVAAAFGGMYFLETERIWTFFIPGAVTSAALLFREWSDRYGMRIVLPFAACAVGTAWAAELVFQQF